MAEVKIEESIENELKRVQNEKEKLLNQRKEIQEKIKKFSREETRIKKKTETAAGMSFYRFMANNKKEEYEKIINSKEFDDYIKSDLVRQFYKNVLDELAKIEK